MNAQPMKSNNLGSEAVQQEDAQTGTVNFHHVSAFDELEGHAIRCTSGYLWVTVRSDPGDHVLMPNQSYTVLGFGKVVIGGKGDFRIEQGEPLALAS